MNYIKHKKRKSVHIENELRRSHHAVEGLCGFAIFHNKLVKNIRQSTIEKNICKRCLKKYEQSKNKKDKI